MFKTLKAIFATPAVATKVAGAVVKGADAAWFTPEEQGEWFIRYLDATQPQNLARRIIAIAASFVWVLSALTLLGLILAQATETAAAVQSFMASVVNPVFLLIVGFYFAKNIAANWSK